MSRFRKLSHTLWHCQYHIVWVPKYRHRILTGNVGHEVSNLKFPTFMYRWAPGRVRW